MTTPIEPTQQAPVADGPGGSSEGAASATNHPGHARRSGSVTGLLVVMAVVAAVGIGFAAGRATSSGQTATGGIGTGQAAGLPAGLGPGGFDPGAFGANVAVTGTVVSVTSDSITIKLTDGQTRTIPTSASTTYHEQSSTTAVTVTAGQTVSVKLAGIGGVPNGLNAGASPGAAAGAQAATDVTITK